MIWVIFRLAILATIALLPYDRSCQPQFILIGCWTCFDLLWLFQGKRDRAYHQAACLLFTGVMGTTVMAFMMGGARVSLALCWPSLMLRLDEEENSYRFALLLLVQILLALSFPPQPLWMVPAALGLLQARPGKLARAANTAAVTWSLGPILEALLFPGPRREAVVLLRSAILLAFPAIAMRFVNRHSEPA